ncbi:MAG: universal stress protein [Acidobacteriota bacterium]|nr:MAG: universal stress protein [Acidobacteriota bacterium]
MTRILLPTDLSEPADHAMRQAVELAVQLQARLDVFHVVTLHAADPGELKDSLEEYLKKLEREVFADLSERSDIIQRRGVSVEVTVERSVSASEAIVDKARAIEADLIVMGTHGRTGVGKLLMGSVAEQVVQHAACDVMTIGNNAAVAEGTSGFDPILVPVDFADYSEKAIVVAQKLRGANGKLIIQHVVSTPIHPSFYAGGVTRMFQLDPELPDRIRERLKTLYEGPGELVVTEGEVAQEILDAAASHKVQMIVMGTRGLSGLDHVLLGSVTERVIRKAQVPVLAVK